ncbi:hypothetical protein BBJ28_00026189, partial [Nothophytophthora sp. Chile5]
MFMVNLGMAMDLESSPEPIDQLRHASAARKRPASSSPLKETDAARRTRHVPAKHGERFFHSEDSHDESCNGGPSEDGEIAQPHQAEEVSNLLDEQQEDYLSARQSQFTEMRTTTPGRPVIYPDGYYPPTPSSGADQWLATMTNLRPFSSQRLSTGVWERYLVKGDPTFDDNVWAAKSVLLVCHPIPVKEFTKRRQKPEDRGGFKPVWGFPWVQRFAAARREFETLEAAQQRGRRHIQEAQSNHAHQRDRIRSLEAELGIGHSADPNASVNAPRSLASLRLDAERHDREIYEIHDRIGRRVTYDEFSQMRNDVDRLTQSLSGMNLGHRGPEQRQYAPQSYAYDFGQAYPPPAYAGYGRPGYAYPSQPLPVPTPAPAYP